MPRLAGQAIEVNVVSPPPLARAPLDPAQAAELAPMFRALGDPVRLRLLSMIAAADDGAVCVCDLTGAFELTGPRSRTT